MKAVVIGGSGLIGAWLVTHLRNRGHEVAAGARHAVAPDVVELDPDDLDFARS